VGVRQHREVHDLGRAHRGRQALAFRAPDRRLLVEVAGRAELAEVHERDAVHQLAVSALALHDRDGLIDALAVHRDVHRHRVVEAQQTHHLGVHVPEHNDLVLGVAQNFEVAIAGPLHVAAYEPADFRP